MVHPWQLSNSRKVKSACNPHGYAKSPGKAGGFIRMYRFNALYEQHSLHIVTAAHRFELVDDVEKIELVFVVKHIRAALEKL